MKQVTCLRLCSNGGLAARTAKSEWRRALNMRSCERLLTCFRQFSLCFGRFHLRLGRRFNWVRRMRRTCSSLVVNNDKLPGEVGLTQTRAGTVWVCGQTRRPSDGARRAWQVCLCSLPMIVRLISSGLSLCRIVVIIAASWKAVECLCLYWALFNTRPVLGAQHTHTEQHNEPRPGLSVVLTERKSLSVACIAFLSFNMRSSHTNTRFVGRRMGR